MQIRPTHGDPGWHDGQGGQGGPRIVDEISVCLMHAMLHCNLVVTIDRRRRTPGKRRRQVSTRRRWAAKDAGFSKSEACQASQDTPRIQDLDDYRRLFAAAVPRAAGWRTNDARPHMAVPGATPVSGPFRNSAPSGLWYLR